MVNYKAEQMRPTDGSEVGGAYFKLVLNSLDENVRSMLKDTHDIHDITDLRADEWYSSAPFFAVLRSLYQGPNGRQILEQMGRQAARVSLHEISIETVEQLMSILPAMHTVFRNVPAEQGFVVIPRNTQQWTLENNTPIPNMLFFGWLDEMLRLIPDSRDLTLRPLENFEQEAQFGAVFELSISHADLSVG